MVDLYGDLSCEEMDDMYEPSHRLPRDVQQSIQYLNRYLNDEEVEAWVTVLHYLYDGLMHCSDGNEEV